MSAHVPTEVAALRRTSGFALELERHLHLRPVGFDLSVLQHHVLLDDLRNPQVTQGFGRPVDGSLCGLLPRFRAGAGQLDDLLDGVWHGILPLGPGVR